MKFAQYGQQDSNPVVTGLFHYLVMAALRWAASQSQSSCPLPEIFEPWVSHFNKLPLDTILFFFSMGMKLKSGCYTVAWFWSQRSDPCHLITVILDNLRLPPLFEGKVFCLHVLSILHIYFSFICQLVWAIDHNSWESFIFFLEKLERKAHSKHIQALWNSTRNFFTSLKIEVLNFALAHSLFIEINVNCSWMYSRLCLNPYLW